MTNTAYSEVDYNDDKVLPISKLNLSFASKVAATSLAFSKLRDVANDTKSRAFCGPTVVAAITGEPISRIRDAFRLVRFGSEWTSYKRAPAIMGTLDIEVERVMAIFGYIGTWRSLRAAPTLASYLEGRCQTERTHPCIVQVTGHYVAVSGWAFCDTFSRGEVVDADVAPGRRKRVKRVFVLTDRIAVRAEIPTKGPGRHSMNSGDQAPAILQYAA